MRVGYHGTDDLEAVLEDGLLVRKADSHGCPIGHLCIAESPEIAAAFGEHVLVIDLTGLELPSEGFCGGEMRIHHDISADRLSVFPHPVVGSLAGHADPFYAYPEHQHPACVRLRTAQAA